MAITPDDIESALHLPLPGINAQLRMSPSKRAFHPSPEKGPPFRGAVLLLIYPRNGSNHLHTALMVRSEKVSIHKGQVSLPGGACEAGDETLIDTAMRETEEELGIERCNIRILGSMTPIYIEPSHFDVHPFVGYSSYEPHFILQTGEVSQIIGVPLENFLDESHIETEEWEIDGKLKKIPFFNVSGHKVWGATAIILSEFTAILSLIAP